MAGHKWFKNTKDDYCFGIQTTDDQIMKTDLCNIFNYNFKQPIITDLLNTKAVRIEEKRSVTIESLLGFGAMIDIVVA